jgi:hypothetical protein
LSWLTAEWQTPAEILDKYGQIKDLKEKWKIVARLRRLAERQPSLVEAQQYLGYRLRPPASG